MNTFVDFTKKLKKASQTFNNMHNSVGIIGSICTSYGIIPKGKFQFFYKINNSNTYKINISVFQELIKNTGHTLDKNTLKYLANVNITDNDLNKFIQQFDNFNYRGSFFNTKNEPPKGSGSGGSKSNNQSISNSKNSKTSNINTMKSIKNKMIIAFKSIYQIIAKILGQIIKFILKIFIILINSATTLITGMRVNFTTFLDNMVNSLSSTAIGQGAITVCAAFILQPIIFSSIDTLNNIYSVEKQTYA